MIRPATLADLPGLRSAIRAAYTPFVTAGLDIPPVDQGLDDDLRDNIVWVATDEAKVLGGFVLVTSGNHAHLANLAVDPNAGGQGLGRRLIEKASALAIEAGHDTMLLTTHAAMTGTRAFYARLGWTEVGHNGNKVNLLKNLMERDKI